MTLALTLTRTLTLTLTLNDPKPNPDPNPDPDPNPNPDPDPDPNQVMASDGHVYDREHIQKWVDQNGAGAKSPKTGEVLKNTTLTQVHPIRAQVREWQEKHGADE